MLLRATKVRLLLFVAISLLGISYVGANFVGLHPFGSNGCTIYADFPDSGGIFTNAEVTYRGVAVGKVGGLHLLGSGIRADIALSDCDKPRIPTSAAAAVTDRSAIGEQYINLTPPNDNGPYVRQGTVIPMQRNSVPTPTYTLVKNLDTLAKSVDIQALATTIKELGQAFNGRGPDLQALIDSGNALLATASQYLPQTLDLIKMSDTVLQTQIDKGSALQSWAHSLDLLSQQLKTSDPDLRHLMETGPGDLQTVTDLVTNNRTDLGVVLADLETTNDITVRHINGVEEILELYPLSVAGGFTVTPGDGTAHFGLVTITTPPQCEQGYGGTHKRPPGDTSPMAPNTDAQCTESASTGVNVRGAQNVPGGDPVYAPNSQAYPRADTSNVVLVGGNPTDGTVLGDSSWMPVLTAGLH